jgi:hypothetical protein
MPSMAMHSSRALIIVVRHINLMTMNTGTALCCLQMFHELYYRMLWGDGATNATQQVVVAVMYAAGMFFVAQVLMAYLLAILFDPYARLR